MSLSTALLSSKSDHWSTPADLYSRLDAEFAFDFDPCPLQSDFDGLKAAWHGRAFCNPPYSKIGAFLRKGLYHLAERDCELLVYLIPARTDTAWFHDYIIGKSQIRFLRGRLRFGDAVSSAPFPSMIVVYRYWALDAMPLEAA
jgi:hypothetical protein